MSETMKHYETPPKRCAYCEIPIDRETCHRDRNGTFMYCSAQCEKLRDRAYDCFVDPLGWYSNPNRIETHD